MTSSFKIMDGEIYHLASVHALITELAIFEKEPEAVTNSLSQLEADFSKQLFNFKVVEIAQEIVGFALYYYRYSTWKGKCLYLEDFYIQDQYRSNGIGSQLFEEVINFAKQQDCKLVTWQVLDWNTEAIKFYERKGAAIDKTWYNGKVALH